MGTALIDYNSRHYSNVNITVSWNPDLTDKLKIKSIKMFDLKWTNGETKLLETVHLWEQQVPYEMYTFVPKYQESLEDDVQAFQTKVKDIGIVDIKLENAEPVFGNFMSPPANCGTLYGKHKSRYEIVNGELPEGLKRFYNYT